MNNLKIKTVIDDHGSVPAYSRDDDAAVDLRASESCYSKPVPFDLSIQA